MHELGLDLVETGKPDLAAPSAFCWKYMLDLWDLYRIRRHWDEVSDRVALRDATPVELVVSGVDELRCGSAMSCFDALWRTVKKTVSGPGDLKRNKNYKCKCNYEKQGVSK